jgi:hypothetical protein
MAMSTQWQSDVNEYRAHIAAETPVDEAGGERVTDASSVDRDDEAHHLLREIATGYCYIGMARWSRDLEVVRANLRCALHVLQSIDAQMVDARPVHPVWPRLQSARDRLCNRLLEEFSALLDQVVHDLPALSREPDGEAVN